MSQLFARPEGGFPDVYHMSSDSPKRAQGEGADAGSDLCDVRSAPLTYDGVSTCYLTVMLLCLYMFTVEH